VRRFYIERQIKNTFAMRNEPDIKAILNLFIQSDVRVWREKDGWIGPFKFLASDGETCTIDMPYELANFRLIVIKSYYTFPEASQEEKDVKIGPVDKDRDEVSY
jgi:hypothetical protein